MTERPFVCRLSVLVYISTARYKNAVERGELRGDQGAVRKLTHPNHEIEPFGDGVGQPFSEIQFDMQARVLLRKRCKSRDDVAFSEGREASDAKGAADRTVEGCDFRMGICQVIQQSLSPIEEMTTRVRQGQGARGADQKRNAKVLFERIDLPDDGGWGYGTTP